MEISLLSFYFSFNKAEYEKWKNIPNYKIPFFHKKKGSLISDLQEKKILSPDQAIILSNLYTNLNRFIHSHSESITNRKIHTGKWVGRHYNPEFTLQWTETYIVSTDIILRIYCNYLLKWGNIPDECSKKICPICHKSDFFIDNDPIFNEIELFTCNECKNIENYVNGKKVNVVRNYEFKRIDAKKNGSGTPP